MNEKKNLYDDFWQIHFHQHRVNINVSVFICEKAQLRVCSCIRAIEIHRIDDAKERATEWVNECMNELINICVNQSFDYNNYYRSCVCVCERFMYLFRSLSFIHTCSFVCYL